MQGAKAAEAAKKLAGTGVTGPPKKPADKMREAVKRIKLSPMAKLVSTVSEQTTGNKAFDPNDVDGKGDEDFFKLMKQRAADYFSADTDGDNMLGEQHQQQQASLPTASSSHHHTLPSSHRLCVSI